MRVCIVLTGAISSNNLEILWISILVASFTSLHKSISSKLDSSSFYCNFLSTKSLNILFLNNLANLVTLIKLWSDIPVINVCTEYNLSGLLLYKWSSPDWGCPFHQPCCPVSSWLTPRGNIWSNIASRGKTKFYQIVQKSLFEDKKFQRNSITWI